MQLIFQRLSRLPGAFSIIYLPARLLNRNIDAIDDRNIPTYIWSGGNLKSIDYLKLVNTAKRQRAGGRLAEPDSRLHAVIWWGALSNAVASIVIGVLLNVMAVKIDFGIIVFAVLGVVPVLIYFSPWLFFLDEQSRISRFMIGIPAFLIATWLAYFALSEMGQYWFVLVPVFIYFSTVASVAFRQMNLAPAAH